MVVGLGWWLAPDKCALGGTGLVAAQAHLPPHSPELTYQEVLSFKPPGPPQPPGSLDIEQ